MFAQDIAPRQKVIAKDPFGRAGHQSTRVIFGAAALGGMKQDKVDAILELLLEYGTNHIDTAAAYGDSEQRIGLWMREHRKHFFLATKTGDRTYEAARSSLHRSLERLKGRSGRFDPTAQPGRGRRMASCARAARQVNQSRMPTSLPTRKLVHTGRKKCVSSHKQWIDQTSVLCVLPKAFRRHPEPECRHRTYPSETSEPAQSVPALPLPALPRSGRAALRSR